MTYLFCAYREWALELYDLLKKKYGNFILITSKKQLTYSKVKSINPKFIFFPDWSWIVPNQILENYRCVCFHESNLPKFKGGSPIQNQIIRGITKTKTTAFLMNEKLDSGDILLQKSLSLEGTLNEIFERMKKNNYDMIQKIIQGKYKIKKQKGSSTYYKRRKPEESELPNLKQSKTYLYNFIRMLSDPYPNAFIRVGNKKIIFKSAKLNNGKLSIEGEIK